MFIITVAPNVALGIVFSTRKNAEITADRLGLSNYDIIQTFARGQEVYYWHPETGGRTLGVVSEILDTDNTYKVDLNDGSSVVADHLRITPTTVGG